jgi:tRNA(adenine34) deaminase
MEEIDRMHLRRAVDLALEAEAAGNMPIGAVLAIGDEIVAEGRNGLLVPAYDPGGHAEITAIRRVPSETWRRASEITCYSTLEPCVMCMGALLLHGVRRVVFGALDETGGARFVLPHLPPYYAEGTMRWEGPRMPEICDPLYRRALARFEGLPCGAR